jgi:hypothetical protein
MSPENPSPETRILEAAGGFLLFTQADMNLLTGLPFAEIARALSNLQHRSLIREDIAESGETCYEWNHDPPATED